MTSPRRRSLLARRRALPWPRRPARESLCAVWLRRFGGVPLHNDVVRAPIDRCARSLPSVPTRMPPCIAFIDFAALRRLRIAPRLRCGIAVCLRALLQGAG